MSTILQVDFVSYCFRPDGRHKTNVLRTDSGAQLVDELTETPNGILAVHVGKNVRYRAFYPWALVSGVAYAPEPLTKQEMDEREKKLAAAQKAASDKAVAEAKEAKRKQEELNALAALAQEVRQ